MIFARLNMSESPLSLSPKGGSQSLYVRISSAIMVISILSAIAFGSYVIAWLVQHNDFATLEGVWAIAAIFVGIAVPLSLHDIHLHLTHYYSPLQRFYVRILWMIPVYSLQSWLALRFKKERIYLVAWRECFEAYVLWSFFHLMLGFLGGKRSLGARLRLRAKKTGEEYLAHLPPCSWCCRRGWSSGARFVHRSAVGVYTYVLLRVLCTIMIVIAELAHAFKEEWANPVYAITTIIINVAQFAALYCLAIFYARLHDELMPMHPLGKFLVIKAVVFLSWWQGLIIAGAVSLKWIPAIGEHNAHDVSLILQDFAITVEMSLAAIAHVFYFSYSDFLVNDKPGQTKSPVEIMQKQQKALDQELEESYAAERQEALAKSQTEVSFDGISGVQASHRVFRQRKDEGEEVRDGPGAPNWAADLELKQRTVSSAVLDMMPIDVLQETGENVRTGFGLTHKWEKRKRERRAALSTWARSELDSLGSDAPVSPTSSVSNITSTTIKK